MSLLLLMLTLPIRALGDDGLDYFDDFGQANPIRWEDGDKAAAHCDDICYEYAPELVLYDQELPDAGGERGLSLLLTQSDCGSCCDASDYEAACNCISEEVCCCNRTGCSKFRGGHLRANESRGYGRFETRLRTGGAGDAGGTVYTKTCFTPTYRSDPWDEIALCFDSDTPHLANFARWAESTTGSDSMHRVQRDVAGYTDQIDSYDHATEYHTYRIDWHPDRIEWYVDDILMKVNVDNIPAEPGETVFIVRPTDSDVYTEDAQLDVVFSGYTAFECWQESDCTGGQVCSPQHQCENMASELPTIGHASRALVWLILLLTAMTSLGFMHRSRARPGKG